MSEHRHFVVSEVVKYICLTLFVAGFLSGFKCDAQSGNFITIPPGKNTYHPNVSQLMFDQHGQLWIATNGGGVFSYDGQSFRAYYHDSNSTPGYFIEHIWQDHQGIIYVRSESGIWQYSGDRWKRNQEIQSLTPPVKTPISESLNTIVSSSEILDYEVDDLGNTWLVLKNQGLSVYNPQNGMTIPIHQEDVTEIEFDQQDGLWMYTENVGLQKYLGQKFELNQMPDNEGISELIVDEDDDLYVLTEGGRIFKKNDDRWKQLFDAQGSDGSFVDFTFDDNRQTYILTQRGEVFRQSEESDSFDLIHKLDDQFTWKQFKPGGLEYFWAVAEEAIFKVELQPMNQPPFVRLVNRRLEIPESIQIESIHVDKLDRLWWLSNETFGYVDDNFEVIEIPTPIFFKKAMTWYEDNSGVLWIGTNGAGVYQYNLYSDDARLRLMRKEDARPWPEINGLIVDENQMYLSTKGSIVESMIHRAESKISTFRFQGNAEGLTNLQIKPNTISKDRFGQIYMGTSQGLLTLGSADLMGDENLKDRHVFFTRIDVDFRSIYETPYASQLNPAFEPKSRIQFQPDVRDLRFQFKMSGLSRHDRIRYQWRLLGRNEQWNPLQEQNEIHFASLEPGQYTLEIRACSVSSNCTQMPARFEFDLIAPFHKQNWFYLACFLAGAGLLIFLNYFRNRRRDAQMQLKHERLELENRTLDLERKALQLQMNPHFIFNAMNTIQSQIKEETLVDARKNLAKFAKLMRRVLESSRMTSVSLDNELDLLKNYVAICELSQGLDIQFDIEIDEKIEVEETHIPSMILQPFIENAIEHGFKGLNRGTIKMKITLVGMNLNIEILDNGHGIQTNSETGRSVALAVIRERLEMMQRPGSFTIEPISSEEQSTGTHVRIKLPLDYES